MSGLSTRHLLAALLALVLIPGLGGVADAQGRRRKPKKDKGKRVSSAATLMLHSGRRRKNVNVREAGYKEIKYKERGRSTSTIKGQDVASIVYTSPPAQYATGRSKFRAQQYALAAASFTKARAEAKADSWPWVHSTYWLGMCHLMNGAYDEAQTEFGKVISKAPEHFLAPAAIFGLGEAQSGAGAHSKAKKTFSKLDEAYGSYWRAKCQLGIGGAMLAKKDATEARKAFKFAEGRGSSYAEIRQAARVGEGKSYVLSKAWDRAVDIFKQTIQGAGVDPIVAGNAYVGMGDCLMGKARDKGSSDPNYKNLLKEALIAYQNCAVRYAGIPEAYPKALYQSASLYAKLGLDKMAQLQRDELKSRCPSSSWAEKLKK